MVKAQHTSTVRCPESELESDLADDSLRRILNV